MVKNLMKKVANRVYMSIVPQLIEKTYSNREQSVRYLFYKRKSPVLIIGFQSCYKGGARYNYVRTIKDVRASRLYIKDDYAPNHRGNYYIGENGKYDVEKVVHELIDTIVEETRAKKIIFIGSSKGGYAAVNFGIDYPNSIIVIGAPQYYLGNYLNNDYQMPNLLNIVGGDCERRTDCRFKCPIAE